MWRETQQLLYRVLEGGASVENALVAEENV